MKLAFDRASFDRASVRSIDGFGRLRVSMANISKAVVNDYLGEEIPYDGLDPKRVYKLLRPAEELEKAAASFNLLQILDGIHIPVSAEDPQTQLIIGSTGTDAVFKAPYLQNSLVIWDAEAIKLIEDGSQKEISCAYSYTPVMTAGSYEGVQYDGYMTDIVGNHVSIVASGRAGSDVVVGDSSNKLDEELKMTKEKQARMLRLAKMAQSKLAGDNNLEQLISLLEGEQTGGDPAPEVDEPLAGDTPDPVAETTTPPAEDPNPAGDTEKPHVAIITKAIEMLQGLLTEEASEPAMDIDPVATPEDDTKVSKVAMDSALKKQREELRAIAVAEKEVAPFVGELVLAADSAADVYKAALEVLGVETEGVHPSAYRILLAMQRRGSTQPIAQDAAGLGDDFAERFPNLGV